MTDTFHPDTPRNRDDHDAPHMSPVTPAEDARTIMINQISWGAVLAGVVLTLAIQLILNLLGIGLGAATLDPGQGAGQNPEAATLGIGAGIWFVVSGIVASFIGGYAAGRLGGKPKESTAGWHGLTAWALSTLLIFYLLTSTLGSIVGGAFSTLGNVAGGVASAAGGAVQTATTAAASAPDAAGDAFAGIQTAIEDAVPAEDAAAARDAAVAAVRALVTGDPAQAETAREEAAQALATARNIPIEEARTQVEGFEEQYSSTVGNVQEQVADVADTAANAVSTGTILGAIGLLIGALAGWFGGRAGAVDPTMTARLTTARTTTTTRL
ncbi:PhnA-like protein [Rubellimicrobium aerolatum]|uniref:PhnA-like protein n=1 Tax=Rubellimicrobium aerolatum TaxID=490979 RepID=A0ABW0SH32_9RHOB|nr:PhnA-like protein [Rubellimicrobium aerolatum]MBP1807649.1 hypothetical protein [Rubellimicrobium aerolatum]